MKTTVEELKELYASMGGTAQDVAGVSTIPDMLAALAEIAGTTIELPAVSSSDNGDVLTVVSGKWAKADLPTELPAVTADDDGDVLTVVEGAWSKAAVPKELPAVTAEDGGKILRANIATGKWEKNPAEVYKTTLMSSTSFDTLLTPSDSVGINIGSAQLEDIFNAADNGRIIFADFAEAQAQGAPRFYGRAIMYKSGTNMWGTICDFESDNVYVLKAFLQKDQPQNAKFSMAKITL